MTIQEFEGKKMKIFAWGGLTYTIPLWIAREFLKMNLELVGALALTFIVFQVLCWIYGWCFQAQGKINAEKKLVAKAKMLIKEEGEE